MSADGCVNWTGRIATNGYGRTDGNKKAAHRAAWEKVHGPIPEGLLVLHKCDNRACVNVDHLFLGTQEDNMNQIVHGTRWGDVK